MSTLEAHDRDGAAASAPPAGPSGVAAEFADALARLHSRTGGSPHASEPLARWAARTWAAAQQGHVCVDLDPHAGDARALSESPVVGDAERAGAASLANAPLVLDAGALYLNRLWQAERGLAAAVCALDRPAPLADAALLDGEIARLFPATEDDDAQARAARAALSRRLVVVSGGPGTGKTTTLARTLVALLRVAPEARVCFAAPTGKAAARLAQSLATQLPQLDPAGTLAGRLPTAGTTVHRLLGVRGGARTGAAATLAFDLVIVDEASMLDLELAQRLFGAIGPDTRLVLAGDMDQLASVEAGAVFAELCASGIDGFVRLARNYRQSAAPRIAALAAAVREGRADDAIARFRPAGSGLGAGADAADADDARAPRAGAGARAPSTDDAVLEPADDAARVVAHAMRSYAPALDALAHGAPADELLRAFDRHRLLAAMREGPLGVAALNEAIAREVRRATRSPRDAPWYPGRLVMVTRNAPGLELFNGDVGVCVSDGAGGALEVAFPGTSPGARRFAIVQVPPCEDAFAITVHKAQGSEFESVGVVLAPPGHPLNTRELLYTAITRARSRLALWADPAALSEACARRTVRDGRLAMRVRDGRVSASPAPRTPSPSRA